MLRRERPMAGRANRTLQRPPLAAKGWHVSSNSSNPNGAAPLRLLAETAALFREETFALDHLVQDLYRDIEQLAGELMRKGDELEEGRRKLAALRPQAADQNKEGARLVQ